MTSEGEDRETSPRLRGDSITDADPWVANKKFDVEGNPGSGGGGAFSPRFLKRSKRSDSSSGTRDKVAPRTPKPKRPKKSKADSTEELSADKSTSSSEPKGIKAKARKQLLRSFSQTNVAEVYKTELKHRGDLPGEHSKEETRKAGSPSQQNGEVKQSPLGKSAPRFNTISTQEKKEFEEKFKGSNIQFYRSAYSKKKGTIVYRNVLEGADQPGIWSEEQEAIEQEENQSEGNRARCASAGDLEGPQSPRNESASNATDKPKSPGLPRLSPRQFKRRESETSDSDADDREREEGNTSPGGVRSRSALLSPRVNVTKTSFLTPDQLREMVRERKKEKEREKREREERENKERHKREKEKKRLEKEREREEKERRKLAKRTRSKGGVEDDDEPFPGISLANDKIKSLLTSTDPPAVASQPASTSAPPSSAGKPMSSTSLPSVLSGSDHHQVLETLALRTSGRDSRVSSITSSGSSVPTAESDHQPSPTEESLVKPEQSSDLKQEERPTRQGEQEDQEKRIQELRLDAERRKKHKKQLAIHLGLSKQQRRSRSFSDLTHFFADQVEEASTKSSKKEKKEKKEKKDKGKKEAQAAPTEAESGPKVDPTALVTVSPPPLATGAEREKELLEIREMLASRRNVPPSKPRSPQERLSERERKKALHRSNSEKQLKMLAAKIPLMLEKAGGKSQIIFSRPENQLLPHGTKSRIEGHHDAELNRGNNGSLVRKRGDRAGKDRLLIATGSDDESNQGGNEGVMDSFATNTMEEAKEEERVFVQVKSGPVFGMTLDEVMQLQRSSESPPASPQPSPSLLSPLSGSPMSCSPSASVLGASSSSVSTTMHFTLSKSEAKLPVVLTALTNAILQFGGTQITGLFRVPGKKATMDVIRERLNSGQYQFEEGTSPHDLASLLKEWLKSVTPPLIPLELYSRCVEVSGRPAECVEVIEKDLPELNRLIIKYVVRFLQQQILSPEVQRATRMDIRSIATAFAPCFLDNPLLSMEELVKNIQAHIKFMVNLLMLLNVNVGRISSNAVPVRKGEDKYQENEDNQESKEPASSEGSRIIPKVVNDRFKKWQERNKTKGGGSARVREERKRSVEKRDI